MIRALLRRVLGIRSPSLELARAAENWWHGWWVGTHRRVWPMRFEYVVRARHGIRRTRVGGTESDEVLCRRLPEAREHLGARS